jgi:DNA-binding IclR family transcriptional regulator
MNRPLGEYQKVMIESVLKKYGRYTIKHPINKQTIRCLDSLVKRGLVTFDVETETYRLKPEHEAK